MSSSLTYYASSEQDPVEKDPTLTQMIEIMNEDPVSVESAILAGGFSSKTYTVTLDNGQTATSTLTVSYTPPESTTYDRYSGTKVAPAIGSEISIAWDYESDSLGGGGFYWRVDLLRVYENAIQGVGGRFIGEAPSLYTVCKDDFYFTSTSLSNRVQCYAVLSFGFDTLIPISTYNISASFLIADDAIAFIFEY